MSNRKMPLHRAILWIVASAIAIWGSAALIWLYYGRLEASRRSNDAYRIVAVVQRGAQRESLKTVYLAELLNLSVDRPTNLYQLDIREAEQKLLASPLIKKAVVKRIKPGTLFIEYAVRQPVAYLGDYTNTAIDQEGIAFPFKPFFTPKKLPEIFLGLDSHQECGFSEQGRWGHSLHLPESALAFDLIADWEKTIEDRGCFLRKVDVSRAFAESAGQRQIIVEVEEKIEREYQGKMVVCYLPRILRLSVEDPHKALSAYVVLRNYLNHWTLNFKKDSTQPRLIVVDLRLPKLAYITDLNF